MTSQDIIEEHGRMWGKNPENHKNRFWERKLRLIDESLAIGQERVEEKISDVLLTFRNVKR